MGFDEVFSEVNLLKIYYENIAKTTAIGIDRLGREQFERQLINQVGVLSKKTKSGTYRFSQYREKLISKGAKKFPREISIPTYRDRIALRALCNILLDLFGPTLLLRIPQVVIQEVKDYIRTGEYQYFAKLDIQNFYPSIDHDLLLIKLKAKGVDGNLLKIIKSAIRTPTVPFPNKEASENISGVPQGLAVSNILAEIYLESFDKYYIENVGIRYFRYVDDILVLSKNEPTDLVGEMRARLLNEFKLEAHPLEKNSNKTVCGIIDSQFTFLGYEFYNQRCRAKSDSVKRLEDSLADIFTTYKYKIQKINSQSLDNTTRQFKLRVARNILMWRVNLRITGCLFENARKGWVFYFSQIDEEHLEQLWLLDRTVDNLIQRFNLPDDCKVKSFVRTYFETKRRDPTINSYIPNFDTTSIEQKRAILSSYFGMAHLDDWGDERIETEFAKRIRRATKELELDIQDIS